MEINNYFTFTLNVSSEGYEKKTDAIACLSSKGAEAIGRKKMCFFEEIVSVDEFLDLAQSGHSFCALYRFEEGKKYWYSNKKGQKYCGYPYYQRDSKTATKGGLKIDFKRDEYFSGSQVIFIDIDDTKYTDINEYISLLTFKPTMVYMSYSDGKEKGGKVSRRFHLCYVFDSILDSEYFKYCSSTLSEALVRDTNEELEDKCGEKMSQYMNGCFGNSENYKTYHIYTINDIDNYYKEYNNNIEYNNNRIEEDKTTTLNIIWQKDQIEVEEEIKDEIQFDEILLNDWDRLDIEEFKKLPSWIRLLENTRHYYRVEKETWIGGLYQEIDDDYFRLFYNFNRVQDGHGRRKDLFMRMCLRKLINPNITVEELVFNTILDIIRQYDNSDGLLNSDFIKRNVISCLDMTLEEIEEKYAGEIAYLKSLAPKRGIIYKDRKSHSKETTYYILDELYDKNLSISENLEIINNDYEFIVSERTLYRYIEDREIKTDKEKLSDEDLMGLTDTSKSCIDNYKYIKSLGYKVGDKRYRRIYKDVVSKREVENRTTTLNTKWQKDQIVEEVNFTTYYNDWQKFEHQESKVEVYSDYDDWFSRMDRLRNSLRNTNNSPF